MSEENKALAREIFGVFTGEVPLSKAEDLIAANSVDHQGIPGIDTNGVDGFRRAVAVFQSGFSEMNTTIEHMADEGDLVFVHFRMTARNTGEFMGAPATNKNIDTHGVDIIRFASGKAVEHWGYGEDMKMMQQLGMMPAQ